MQEYVPTISLHGTMRNNAHGAMKFYATKRSMRDEYVARKILVYPCGIMTDMLAFERETGGKEGRNID
jgi:hypothetical protein